jgi:hypothetical protein
MDPELTLISLIFPILLLSLSVRERNQKSIDAKEFKLFHLVVVAGLGEEDGGGDDGRVAVVVVCDLDHVVDDCYGFVKEGSEGGKKIRG